MSYTEEIKEFIVDNFLFGESNGLDDEMSLFERGIISSSGILELIAFMEEKYNITFADNELTPKNFSNIKTIGAFVKEKITAG